MSCVTCFPKQSTLSVFSAVLTCKQPSALSLYPGQYSCQICRLACRNHRLSKAMSTSAIRSYMLPSGCSNTQIVIQKFWHLNHLSISSPNLWASRGNGMVWSRLVRDVCNKNKEKQWKNEQEIPNYRTSRVCSRFSQTPVRFAVQQDPQEEQPRICTVYLKCSKKSTCTGLGKPRALRQKQQPVCNNDELPLAANIQNNAELLSAFQRKIIPSTVVYIL